MPISANALAYGTVIVVAVSLFLGGTPADRSAALQARRAATHETTPPYSAALAKQLAANGPHAAPAFAEAAGLKLRSVGFDLPTSDRAFPPGPGAELIGKDCAACHSAGMILTQPQLTRAEWTGEVTKMIKVYKAPVPEEDVAGIVTYLAALKIAL